MLDHSNLEEYQDAERYQFENAAFAPDGPFWLALTQRVGGRVLELGSGTGRITIPLARAGVDVSALELVPSMLALARREAGTLPIQWVEADLRSFRLSSPFRLIFMAGGTFGHLLHRAEQEVLLASVRAHLEPNGRFAFDALIPTADLMANVDEEESWHDYVDTEGRTIRLSGTQRYDPIAQLKHETAYRRWVGADGKEIVERARLALRYSFPQELEALIHHNGLAVVERYGDWDGGPLTTASQTMILIAARRTDEPPTSGQQ